MNPNATLEILRQLVVRVHSRPNATAMDADAHELASVVMDLDDWLNNGGSLPADWKR